MTRRPGTGAPPSAPPRGWPSAAQLAGDPRVRGASQTPAVLPVLAPANGEPQRLAFQVADGARASARRGRFHPCPSLLPLSAGRRARLLLLPPSFPPAAGSGLRPRTVSTSATVSSSQEKEKGGERLGKVFPVPSFLSCRVLLLAEVCRSSRHCFARRLPFSRPSPSSFGLFQDQSISFASGGEDSGVTNRIFHCFPFLHNTDSTKGYSLSRDLYPRVR